MNLELKHIAPYLLYKPFCLYDSSYCNTIEGIKEVEHDASINNRKRNPYLDKVMSLQVLIKLCNNEDLFWVDTFKCKLVLRPLSDLTKEIDVNGEKFVPIHFLVKIGYENRNKVDFDFYSKKYDYHALVSNLDIYFKLLEWHFDVFSLIEQGLAVDINTLNH